MSRKHLNLLVDTNVWVDYVLGRKDAATVSQMLSIAAEGEDAVAVTPAIMKDAFFLIESGLKRMAREQGSSEKAIQDMAASTKEAAWASLCMIQKCSIMLNQGFQEHLEAMTLRDEHNDYEDDLLLATAKSAKIDYLITNDKGLLSNKVVPALSPQAYLDMKQSKKS